MEDRKDIELHERHGDSPARDIKQERRKIGLNDSDFVVGFAGRIVERKGWKEYVNVAKSLKNENIKFLIAGSGEEKEKLLNFIKTNNLNNVI